MHVGFLGFLLAVGLWLPVGAEAAGSNTGTLVRDFITCQARYAAQAEYDRTKGRDAQGASMRVDAFEQLVGSVLPPGMTGPQQEDVSRLHDGAREAHWMLLHTAETSFDARLARHARATALRNIRLCEMLVLG